MAKLEKVKKATQKHLKEAKGSNDWSHVRFFNRLNKEIIGKL